MTTEVKEVLDELGRTVKEFKDDNDKRLSALEERKDVPADLDEKIERMGDAIDRLEERKDAEELKAEVQAVNERFDEFEAKLKFPGETLSPYEQEQKTHLQLWERWFRSCREGKEYDLDAARELKQFERSMETKASQVETATPAAGGFAVPEVIGARIAELRQKFSPFRQLIGAFTVGTPDYKELVDIGGETYAWVGETDTRNATDTAELRERAPTFGEIMALPKATEHSLDDLFFNVTAWVSRFVARAFAKGEGDAILSGNGTNRPTGFLNTTPVTTADEASPLRSAEALQYVPIGTGSPVAMGADGLIDLLYEVHEDYAGNGTWALNRVTLRDVRKLKDQNDQYLWSPGLAGGEPSTILGYPYAIMGKMANPVADAYPIAFGDWTEMYMLCDRVGLRVTLDQITSPGFVRWYFRQRIGGKIRVNDAVKVGKVSLT